MSRRLLAGVSVALLAMSMASPGMEARRTEHFGPFATTSPERGTCGQIWAEDTFDRHFKVHDNGDGTFRVREQFKNGTFTTFAGPSPGSCEADGGRQGTAVIAGIEGRFGGFFAFTIVSDSFDPNGCDAPHACDTRQGFITAVFGPGATLTCATGGKCDFNFEYSSSDRRLIVRHWQDKSDNQGDEQFIGDIATS